MTEHRDQNEQSSTIKNLKEVIVPRLHSGDLVPILSNGLTNELVLGGHKRLLEAYAKRSKYSGTPCGLSKMAQLRYLRDLENRRDEQAFRDDYVSFIKQELLDIAKADGVEPIKLQAARKQFDKVRFSEICDVLGYPRLNDDNHPLLTIANWNVKVYVTTAYHDFLEQALIKVGKLPRIGFCRWTPDLMTQEPLYDEKYEVFRDEYYAPNEDEPLVFHLHGLDIFSRSLVLTEDDYLRFFYECVRSSGADEDPVHFQVRQAISTSSLMLLGYELSEWDFRSLFWSLIVPRSKKANSVVAIQLEPSKSEKEYLTAYLLNYLFEVFWGSTPTFLEQLMEVMSNE